MQLCIQLVASSPRYNTYSNALVNITRRLIGQRQEFATGYPVILYVICLLPARVHDWKIKVFYSILSETRRHEQRR